MKSSIFKLAFLTVLVCLFFSDDAARTRASGNQTSGFSMLAPAAVRNGKIVFTSGRTGNDEVFIMNPDGSHQINISNHPAHEFAPSVSPDGRRIAFTRLDNGSVMNVYTMNVEGTNQIRLTTDGNNYSPGWSPDGTKIVYAKFGEIYLMNADGSNQHRLSTHVRYDAYPRFSPDGTKITYLCSRTLDGTDATINDEICLMNADGTNETILTRTLIAESSAVFSPDGSKIAYNRGIDGNSNSQIFVMNAGQ